MYKIIIISILLLSLCGCASTRALESARESITELERLTTEQESRNSELAELLKSERADKKEQRDLLSELREENDRFAESERLKLEEKREFLVSLEFIFSAESDLTGKILEITRILRDYFESLEVLE